MLSFQPPQSPWGESKDWREGPELWAVVTSAEGHHLGAGE